MVTKDDNAVGSLLSHKSDYLWELIGWSVTGTADWTVCANSHLRTTPAVRRSNYLHLHLRSYLVFFFYQLWELWSAAHLLSFCCHNKQTDGEEADSGARRERCCCAPHTGWLITLSLWPLSLLFTSFSSHPLFYIFIICTTLLSWWLCYTACSLPWLLLLYKSKSPGKKIKKLNRKNLQNQQFSSSPSPSGPDLSGVVLSFLRGECCLWRYTFPDTHSLFR